MRKDTGKSYNLQIFKQNLCVFGFTVDITENKPMALIVCLHSQILQLRLTLMAIAFIFIPSQMIVFATCISVQIIYLAYFCTYKPIQDQRVYSTSVFVEILVLAVLAFKGLQAILLHSFGYKLSAS